ncbi:MAG: oleate hydratase, partial [Janthinobacterium sp.]
MAAGARRQPHHGLHGDRYRGAGIRRPPERHRHCLPAPRPGRRDRAPAKRTKHDSHGWRLWEKLAEGRPELGRPAAFNSSIPESYWASYTVTLKDSAFFDRMEQFTGNSAGTGGLVTFKDS